MAAVIPRSPPPPASSAAEASASGAAGSAAEAPVLIFVYFHKAIRAELEKLHAAAVRLATEGGADGDVAALERRCRFLFSVYRHHCDAEDAVWLLPITMSHPQPLRSRVSICLGEFVAHNCSRMYKSGGLCLCGA